MGTTIKRTTGTLLSLALLLTACGGGPSAEGGQDPTSSSPSADAPLATDDEVADTEASNTEVTDDLGSVTAATLEELRNMDPEAMAAAHDHSGHDDHHTHARHADLPNSVEPERIVIDAIGVDADIIDLGYEDDGEIEVPTDFAQTGWFTDSPRPGRVGSSVIAGHVDSRDGPAVFFRLAELAVGDEIEIRGENGDVVTFQVTGKEQHAKSEFPAEKVHRSTGKPELKLVTCGGVFDADERSYRDNIIVSAERVDL